MRRFWQLQLLVDALVKFDGWLEARLTMNTACLTLMLKLSTKTFMFRVRFTCRCSIILNPSLIYYFWIIHFLVSLSGFVNFTTKESGVLTQVIRLNSLHCSTARCGWRSCIGWDGLGSTGIVDGANLSQVSRWMIKVWFIDKSRLAVYF